MKLALLFLGLAAAYLLIGWLVSFPIRFRSYTLSSPKIKAPVRLAVVSDLHSTVYGPDQKRLLDKLRQSRCDLILMPGDIIDDIKPLQGAEMFLDQVSAIAPCYYCTGNHENIETMITQPEVKERVRQAGITVLDKTRETITLRGTKLTLCGVDDPRKYAYIDRDQQEEVQLMNELGSMQDCPEYTILLAHRPERSPIYAQFGFDLIVSGHAHGGQVRIPGLINGLFAPRQGWFPKRAGGLYREQNSDLVVSRGLCQRWYLPRIYNPVEIPVIEITPILK